MLADPELLFDGPITAKWTIALAHGAGMDTPFMNFFATRLANSGFRVVQFEFPYMASSRTTGKKRPPDREPVLRETWLKVVNMLGHKGLVVGGKSMGGRIASLIADETQVDGLVCLGYPFHPVGKPNKLQVEHLESIKTPTLVTVDTFARCYTVCDQILRNAGLKDSVRWHGGLIKTDRKTAQVAGISRIDGFSAAFRKAQIEEIVRRAKEVRIILANGKWAQPVERYARCSW